MSSFKLRRDSGNLSSSLRSEKSPSPFSLMCRSNSFSNFVLSRRNSESSTNLTGKKDNNSSVGGGNKSVDGDAQSVEGDLSPGNTIEGDEESITGERYLLRISSVKGNKIIPVMNDTNIV